MKNRKSNPDGSGENRESRVVPRMWPRRPAPSFATWSYFGAASSVPAAGRTDKPPRCGGISVAQVPAVSFNPKSVGSVLVFSLVILGLLAMISMTFLVTVRQASRAAQNALGPLEADLAAQAGMNHAQAILRSYYTGQIIATPDAVFTQSVPYSPPYKTNGSQQTQGPFWVSYLRQFNEDRGYGYGALLSVDDATNNEPRYTYYAPLRVSTQTNTLFFANTAFGSMTSPAQTPVDRAVNAPGDRAFKWDVQGATNDFYYYNAAGKVSDPSDPNILPFAYYMSPKPLTAGGLETFKQLPRVGSVRGCYHVWVDDLDAKLSLNPDPIITDKNIPNYVLNPYDPAVPWSLWSIDVTNVSTGSSDVPPGINAPTVRKGILSYFNTFLINQHGSMPMSSYYSSFQQADLYYILNIQPPQAYDTLGDCALNMPTLNQYVVANTGAGLAYEDLRWTTEYYFKAGCLNGVPLTPFPGALNINTATEEVIEAALSQIPAYDATSPQTPSALLSFGGNPTAVPPIPAKNVGTKADGTPCSLANWLAVRIVAKRPFLCRMDFEDFLAAQLGGSITDQATPLGAIYAAILARVDPTRPDGKIELSVQQYLEIPGNSQDLASYTAYGNCLLPHNMQARFQFFAVDNPGTPPTYSHVLSNNATAKIFLEMKELNNVMNSVFHKGPGCTSPLVGACPDRQITAAGEKGVLVIYPGGQNGKLSTTPTSPDVPGKIIVPIPGTTLQTKPVAPDLLITEPMVCIAPGPTGVLKTPRDPHDFLDPTGLCIVPGWDGTLHSTLAAGDVISSLTHAYIIPGGPTRSLNTMPTGTDMSVDAVLSSVATGIGATSIFGFSYYSHDTAPQYYMPCLCPNPSSFFPKPYPLYPLPFNPSDPAYVGKFVYRNLTKESQTMPSSATAVWNYSIGDLQQGRWSCIGNGTRSGYYDMFFNPMVDVPITGDVMRMQLGEQFHSSPPDATNDPTHVCVESDGGTKKLRTGWQTVPNAPAVAPPLPDDQYGTMPANDDVAEHAPGDTPVGALDVLVSPGPTGLAKGSVQTQPSGSNVFVKAILVNQNNPWVTAGDDGWDLGLVSGNFFVLPGPNGVLDTPLGPGDQLVQVIVGGGGYDVNGFPVANDTCTTSIPTKETIQVGANCTNDTFVWGPLRASQRASDQRVPDPLNAGALIYLNPDQFSSAGLPPILVTSGVNKDGDVSWSPQFTFRSRFFGIYVLGRGLERQWFDTFKTGYTYGGPENKNPNDTPGFPQNPTPEQCALRGLKSDGVTPIQKALRVVGERRLEAVYDAQKDEVIWQRAPATDKRSLADP
ncbi:MAG: hypothetical protein ABSE73_10035 [Planctomycetota bacterium]